jgi:hypothetical protein
VSEDPRSAERAASDASLPVGRTVLTALLLRRFGLLPLLAVALAGRGISPGHRNLVLTVAASVYLGALALLVLLLVVLVGGLAIIALTV